MMDEGEVQYLTGNQIGDGILGVIATHIALIAFWWVGFGIALVLVPLFAKEAVRDQTIGAVFVAPIVSWILAILLVRPIKRKYRTLGRAYQATAIVYGVIYFGGLGICLVLLSSFTH